MNRFVIFLFLPFACAAQGVKTSQFDVFLKKQRIEMEPVTLLSTPANKLTVTFSSLARESFVELKGAGWGATTVDEGNELLFLFGSDSAVKATATTLQTFEPGVPLSTYKHQYKITSAALQALARYNVTGLRKFSFKESSDMLLPKESAAKLQKASLLFLTELAKATTARTLQTIDASQADLHIGDSVQFCSRVFNTRTDGSLTLEMQTSLSDPIVNVVILPQDRTAFENSSDAFLNKDVCVRGTLFLRDNTPTMIVRTKDQLKLKSPTTDASHPQ